MTDWFDAERFPIDKGREIDVRGKYLGSLFDPKTNKLTAILIEPECWKPLDEQEPKPIGEENG